MNWWHQKYDGKSFVWEKTCTFAYEIKRYV